MSELKQTDLSKRLRQLAGLRCIAEDHAKIMCSAADEIERYYTIMLNWKATAEAQSTQPEATKPTQDAERTGTLYQAVQRAAGELPEGWTICLEIERDAGTVELIDPEGNRKLIDGNDGYLCQAVNEATNAAIQAQKDGHG